MAKIIAELCQNHKGDRVLLKEMIQAAAESGADYAKIQSIRSDDLTFRERFENGIEEGGVVKAIKRPYRPEYDRLKPMDLGPDDHVWFIEECGRAGITPLTTIFTRSSVPFLAGLPWKEIKVASYDCASLPLSKDLKNRFEHLIISTGATHDGEIETTAHLLAGKRFSFLHCITIYPTPLNELNLRRLNYLKRFTPSVGFSDHTLVARDGLKGSFAAIALGADLIERHFTVLEVDKTKDGPVSITPPILKELVRFARLPLDEAKAHVKREIPEVDAMLGEERRSLSHAELLNRDYYRGRFASKVGDRVIYNWEDLPLS